jgi:hypothetical protein
VVATAGSEKPAASIFGGGRSAAALSEAFMPFYQITRRFTYLFIPLFMICLTLSKVQTLSIE